MCTEVTHEYTACKHKVVEKVACAVSRRMTCNNTTHRTVVHHQKCYSCGGGRCKNFPMDDISYSMTWADGWKNMRV